MPFFKLIPISLLTALFLGGLSACSSISNKKASCEQKDWFETGRLDGAQGATLDKLSSYKSTCGRHFQEAWETLYENGRNSGLVEYCAAENSYELGRMGISYMYVCPSTVEPEFLAGYRRGQKARELEIEIQKLDSQIETKSTQLIQISDMYERRQIASELASLRKVRERSDRQLERINN